jgi:hypothetical protein
MFTGDLGFLFSGDSQFHQIMIEVKIHLSPKNSSPVFPPHQRCFLRWLLSEKFEIKCML